MEDGRPRLSSTTHLARALSVAGHPFVVIPFTVAITSRSLLWTAVIAAGVTLPLIVITFRNVRRGTWSDHDVSRRDQRSGLYRVGLPLLALSALTCWILGASPTMMRSFLAGAVMLTLGLLGNRWLKISLHMMFAGFGAVLIGSWLAIPFLLAIAWSRWYLRRHTLAEIAVGLAIGAACGFGARAS